MSEADLLAYTGTMTGIVGAITGIAGAIMGYVGYRRTEDLKALDLRIELQKANSDLRQLVLDLPSHLEFARKSRKAVSSATGRLDSGALEQWLSECEVDLAAASSMIAGLPSPEGRYQGLSHADLEQKLVEVHVAASEAAKLRQKYDASLAADEKDRDHIKQDTRARWQAKVGGRNEPGA
jgi:hypothetical protein